ncbi:ATP-dependent RNA helicase RhlE [Nymphon striatum]|nr:ATP-dependent RNA helicase RhlE [Nymphon striatum]
MGYETPTPIQEECIPLILKGHDIMGLAQTGTGKTAAFGLPLIQNLLSVGKKPEAKTCRALILAPTRELANQINANLRAYVRHSHLKVQVVVGGASINIQARNLAPGADILVATPGRLLDLIDRKAADQMLDLGFIVPLKKIAKMLAVPRTTLLFSATMPKSINDLAGAYLNDPIRVQVSPPGKAADKIKQSVHFISGRSKADLLKDCLNEKGEGLSLVFSRTKHGAEKLKKHLVERGFAAESIHGNKSQNQREHVAARGIDISGVTHVFNYDLPEVAEAYVHRIGRTARAGAEGEAIAFCAPDDIHLLRAIEKLMSIKIEVASGEAPPADFKPAKKTRGGGNKGGGGRKRSGGGAGHRGRRSVAEMGAPKQGGGEQPANENKGGGAAKPKNKKRASQGKRYKVADPNGGPPRWAAW